MGETEDMTSAAEANRLETMPAAEYDGLLITAWLENREYAPMLGVSADDRYRWAHDNPDAWDHAKIPEGLERVEAQALMQAAETREEEP